MVVVVVELLPLALCSGSQFEMIGKLEKLLAARECIQASKFHHNQLTIISNIMNGAFMPNAAGEFQQSCNKQQT